MIGELSEKHEKVTITKEKVGMQANAFNNDADPLTFMAEKIPLVAYANDNVNYTITTKNAQGECCSKGGSKVIAQVQSSSTGEYHSSSST